MKLTPEQLTEGNFQGFLDENRQYVFIFEDEDRTYPQYFAVAKLLTSSTRSVGRFARQYG